MRAPFLIVFLFLFAESAICLAEPLLLSAKDLNQAIDHLPAITQADPVEGLESRLSQLAHQPNNPERQALNHALHLIDIVRSIKLVPEQTIPVLDLVASNDVVPQ